MGHELICGWLDLKPDEWPPDHYRLLGLEVGETDTDLIEQRVHQRLDVVRCYQMLHPDQATEAMNRLAQAFVCLTEPAAKKLYDASLPNAAVPAVAVVATSAALADTVIETRDPLSWLNGPAVPPPLPVIPPPLPAPGTVTPSDKLPPDVIIPPPLPVVSSALEPIDPVVAAAQSSREARRGLGSKRALYHRIARTRQLLRSWDQIGHHLATPKRRPLRRAEILDLLEKIEEVHKLLRGFPPLLGQAGQPGYHVLVLDQVDPAQLQRISPSQRESLGRDWKSGHKLLSAHRDFLRQESRALRKRTLRQRVARAVRGYLTDQPAAVLVLLGLLAVNIALLGRWRTAFETLLSGK